MIVLFFIFLDSTDKQNLRVFVFLCLTFHLALYHPGSSLLLQVKRFHSFYGWVISSLSTYSDEQFGWFHILAIVNNATMNIGVYMHAHSIAQSCLSLGNPMDCSRLAFTVHGIFWARILQWVAISYSRISSQNKDQTQISCSSLGRRILYHCATWEAQGCIYLF